MSSLKKSVLFGLVPLAAISWYLSSSTDNKPVNHIPRSEPVQGEILAEKTGDVDAAQSLPEKVPEWIGSGKSPVFSSSKQKNITFGNLSLFALDDIIDYYFLCDRSEYSFEEQGETILSLEEDGSRKLEEINKICQERVDRYLAYLDQQGLEEFLEKTYEIQVRLSVQEGVLEYRLRDGLERLGTESAVLALLNLSVIELDSNYSPYLSSAQELVRKGATDPDTAAKFYLPLFYKYPTKAGFKFLIKNLPKEEMEAFVREAYFTGDETILKALFKSSYLIPENVLWKIYALEDNNANKVRLLGELFDLQSEEEYFEFSESGFPEELADIFKDAEPIDQMKILAVLEKEAQYYEGGMEGRLAYKFLANSFQNSQALEEIMLFGEALGDNLIYLGKSQNLNQYLLEKANQTAPDSEKPVKIILEKIDDRYLEGLKCQVYLTENKVSCEDYYEEEYPEEYYNEEYPGGYYDDY